MTSNLAKFAAGIVLAMLVLSMAPVPVAHAQTAIDENTGSRYDTSVSTVNPVIPMQTNAEITCDSLPTCIALVVYYIGPGLAGWVAYIGAYFFSIVIQLSLNSTAYALQFLSDGWSIVRDLANMAFIFILVYLALTIMLQAETSGTIKTLAAVIVVALLVNFSFFFTRVAIDMGNIVALQFYNAIDARNPEKAGQVEMIGGAKDLSYAIMRALNPQTLLSTQSWQNARAAANNSNWGALAVVTVIYLATAAMMWMLFFSFLMVGIKFMMRIVGLWFVLIASPLAFVAKTMGKTEHYFDQWFRMLFQFAAYPAIFLFMYFVLTKIAAGMVTGNTAGTGGIFDSLKASEGLGAMSAIASVGIRLGFIIATMYIGLRVADWLVKEGSASASKITAKVTGSSFGLAAGAAGWTGRKVIGRAAVGAEKMAVIAKRTGVNPYLWRGVATAMKPLQNATFDVRNTPGAGLVKKGVEKYIGATPTVGKAATEGFATQAKARAEQKEKDRKERAATLREAANEEALRRIEKDISKGRDHDPADVAHVQKMKGSEIVKKDVKSLESFAHILTEGQLKAIEESDRFTDAEKGRIGAIAEPISRGQKIIVDELRKLNSNINDPAYRAHDVDTHTAPGSTVTLTTTAAMHTDITAQMSAIAARLAAPVGLSTLQIDDLKSDYNQLRNANRRVSVLERELRKVPAHHNKSDREFVTY